MAMVLEALFERFTSSLSGREGSSRCSRGAATEVIVTDVLTSGTLLALDNAFVTNS